MGDGRQETGDGRGEAVIPSKARNPDAKIALGIPRSLRSLGMTALFPSPFSRLPYRLWTSSFTTSSTRMVSWVKNGSPYRVRIRDP